MAANRSAHDRLLILQKRIYRSLQKQADRLLGEMPEAIRRYEREYREDFKRVPRRPREVKKDELIEEIRQNDVTLIGDFHTFSQAQRTALRLLREAVKRDETWYLGLEMFPSHFQDALDRFQGGTLSEEHFLEEIGYESEWGFPWSHYSPIIYWAIRKGVKLIALNRPRTLRRVEESDENELKERDRWAVGIITDLFQAARASRTKLRMVVLYGELHVGRKHLPASLHEISKPVLGQSLRTLAIHQNYDELYWRIARQGRELNVEVIRLRKKSYCVLSSPPWARLQSVINWAEGISPVATRSDLGKLVEPSVDFEDDEEIDELDPYSLMKQYGEIIAEFFSLPRPSFDSIEAYTIRNADFAERLRDVDLSPMMKRILKYHVLHNHRIYLPSAHFAYLATPNENGSAEIAAIHIFSSVTRDSDEASSRKDGDSFGFYRWILENAFGFLGSLIINPRRKCDLIADHQKRILELERDLDQTYPHEKEARELAVELLSPEADFSRLDRFFRNPKLAPALYFAARYVGFALAKQVQRSLLEEEIGLAELKRIFFGDTDGGRAPSFWRFNALRSAALKSNVGTSKSERL
jgi:hypothetical protein